MLVVIVLLSICTLSNLLLYNRLLCLMTSLETLYISLQFGGLHLKLDKFQVISFNNLKDMHRIFKCVKILCKHLEVMHRLSYSVNFTQVSQK